MGMFIIAILLFLIWRTMLMFLEQLEQLKAYLISLKSALENQKAEVRSLLTDLKVRIKALEDQVATFNSLDLTESLDGLNSVITDLSTFVASADTDTALDPPVPSSL